MISRLLALAAGALLPLGMAPYGYWPLTLLAIAALGLLWYRSPSAKHSAWLGYAFGLGAFGLGVSWVHVSIHVHGQASLPVSVGITLLFVAFLALFYALPGYVLKRYFDRQHPVAFATACACLCLLGDWVRGWIFTGFPWLYVGYSQIDGPLSGYVPILGVYALSALMTFSLTLAAVTLYQRQLKWGLLAIAPWLIAPGLQQITWTSPIGSPLNVALIQANIPQEIKWLPEQRYPTLSLYRELTRIHWDKDLIIWPETAVPLLRDKAEPFLQRMGDEAQSQATSLVTGIPSRAAGDRQFYNSILALGAGEGTYHKQRLVPFGEFVPFESLLRGVIAFFDLPMSSFIPGSSEQGPLRVGEYHLFPYICYEIAYADLVWQTAPQADFLVTISNDAWFGRSIGPHQHLEIARMRALESGRDLLRATNTGITAVIDHRGQITAQLPQFERDVLVGQVQARQGATPITRIGLWPWLLLSGLLLAGLAYQGRLVRK